MRFGLSVSPASAAQIVQNYALDDPDLTTALAKEENYPSAKELFLHLLKHESLLKKNKVLVTRLIQLIKLEDLNGPLGDELYLSIRKLYDLGIFKLLCIPQSLSAFHPNVLWMISGNMRKKLKEDFISISLVELMAEEAKYSAPVVGLIREYVESRKLEHLLQALLQSANPDDYTFLLKEVLSLAKFLNIDGFQADFKKAIQKCQMDLLPPSFTTATVADYREMIKDYELSLLDCALDFYENPSSRCSVFKQSSAAELFEKLLTSHRSLEIFVPLLTYLFDGIPIQAIKGFKDNKCIGDKLVRLGIINLTKLIESTFSSKPFFWFAPAFLDIQDKKKLACVSSFFLKSLQDPLILGRTVPRTTFQEEEFFTAIEEMLKLAKQSGEAATSKMIEDYLVCYEINAETAEKYLIISKKYGLASLLYMSSYYLNPQDPFLTEPIHQPTVAQLFSMYAKCDRLMSRRDPFLHLFRLLKFDDIPSFLECKKWVGPYLFNCSLDETTNKKEGSKNEEEIIKIMLKEDSTEYLLSKRVLKLISPFLFSIFEAYHKENNLLVCDCSKASLDFLIEYLSNEDMTIDKLLSVEANLKENFYEFLEDLMYLTEMWQLDGLKKTIEDYLVQQKLCIENAQEFSEVELGMPVLAKCARKLSGYLREDAKGHTINSKDDLEACCVDPEGVKSITWGPKYSLTEKKLKLLKDYCTGVREFTLEAQSLIKTEADLIDGFHYLENITISQSDQPVSIAKDIGKLKKCKALKLEGFLIDEPILKELIELSQLKSLDISMCQLDVPFYLFFKFLHLKSLSLPLLHNKDELLSTYLQLLVYYGVTIHLSPTQPHLLDKKMSEIESKEAREQLENMLFSLLNEKDCSSYLACAKKYQMKHLVVASTYYNEGYLKSLDDKIQILDFFIEHPSFIKELPCLREYTITSIPLDFNRWEEYAQKGEKCGFDALVKHAHYCLQGPRKGAKKISVYSKKDLQPYLHDRSSVKGVELKKDSTALEMLAAYFPAITSLKLDVSYYAQYNSINWALQRFQKLESLWFTKASRIKTLLKSITTIKSLRVQKGCFLDKDFKYMCHLSQLENLDLRGADLANVLEFNEILKLNHLKEIKFSLNQLLEAPHFSTSILEDLCKKGVSIDIDSINLDLTKKNVCPKNVTELLRYAKKTQKNSLKAAFMQQLKMQSFVMRSVRDLQRWRKLCTFAEFSFRWLLLSFNYQEEDMYQIPSVASVLQELVTQNIEIRKLNIANWAGPNSYTSLNQEVFDTFGQLKNLEKLHLKFWGRSENNFDLSPLLDLPHLKNLKISQFWLQSNKIKPENFFRELKQRGVKFSYI